MLKPIVFIIIFNIIHSINKYIHLDLLVMI